MIRRALVLGLIAPCLALASACQQAAQTSPAPIEADSLKGIVSITGTSFEQLIVLRSGNGVTRLSAATPDSGALSRMGGIEVMVYGSRTSTQFLVDRFTAVSVADASVVDGILRTDEGRLVLETSRGRLSLGNPPTALRGMVGARVWIAGPLDTGPNSYGVIAPRR